jgi:hypothetical protein
MNNLTPEIRLEIQQIIHTLIEPDGATYPAALGARLIELLPLHRRPSFAVMEINMNRRGPGFFGHTPEAGQVNLTEEQRFEKKWGNDGSFTAAGEWQLQHLKKYIRIKHMWGTERGGLYYLSKTRAGKPGKLSKYGNTEYRFWFITLIRTSSIGTKHPI